MYLNIDENLILLINLCQIYRSPEIPFMVQHKTDQWPLTKNKTWLYMTTLDQCAVSDEVVRAIGKN